MTTRLQSLASYALELRLSELIELKGRVVDGEGTGLAGVQVQVTGLTALTVLTASSGDFVLGRLHPKDAREIQAKAPGFAQTKLDLSAAHLEGREPLVVTLQPGRRVFGWVEDPEGHALSGATATLGPAHQDAWNW